MNRRMRNTKLVRMIRTAGVLILLGVRVSHGAVSGESTPANLEQQISALEQQLTAPSDPAEFRSIKNQLGQLYQQRPQNQGRNSLDQGGDNCANVTVIHGLPFTDAGFTTGFGDNFSPPCGVAGGAPDVIYQFTAVTTAQYTLGTCGSSFDTELYIRTGGNCPGQSVVACNDDSCSAQSMIVVTLNAGQTYWIIVDGYNAASGFYQLQISDNCSIPCVAGDSLEVTENFADPNFFNNDPDGGCSTNPPRLGRIYCGETICGLSVAADNQRDFDIYRLTTTNADNLHLTMQAEFPFFISVMTESCSQILFTTVGNPCQITTLDAPCLPPGNYSVSIRPATADGVSVPRHYRVHLECDPCQPGRCCYGDIHAPQCASDFPFECTALGGQWRSDITCATHPCVPAPTCNNNISGNAQLPDPPGGFSTYVSDVSQNRKVVQFYPSGNSNTGHLRFWGMFPGDSSYVPQNALFRVEYYNTDFSDNPNTPPYQTDTVRVTGTPIDVYNVNGTVIQAYQFDADIPPTLVLIGWFSIQSIGPATRNFAWLSSASNSPSAVRFDGSSWVGMPTNVALCPSPVPCLTAAETCPGVTIPPVLPFTSRGNTDCSPLQIANCDPNQLPLPSDIYSWTPDYCQTVEVSLCRSAFDTELEIRTGGNCPGDSIVACNDNACGILPRPNLNSRLTFIAYSGQTYYIVVTGSRAGGELPTGAYMMSMTESGNVIAANDVCPGTVITALPYNDSGTTVCAANDYLWSCVTRNYPDSRDVVYHLTLPVCSRVTASLCGSDFDTGLEVRTGGVCPGATMVACNDDDYCNGQKTLQSTVSFDAQPGITYYLLVDGYDGASGFFHLNVDGTSCPHTRVDNLTIQPQGTSIVLHWSPVAGATLHHVYRGGSYGFPLDAGHLIATVSDSAFVDSGILNSADISDYYVVTGDIPAANAAADLPAFSKEEVDSRSRQSGQ